MLQAEQKSSKQLYDQFQPFKNEHEDDKIKRFFKDIETNHPPRDYLDNVALREKCPVTEFFSGPYFPVFGLTTERHWAPLRIESES